MVVLIDTKLGRERLFVAYLNIESVAGAEHDCMTIDAIKEKIGARYLYERFVVAIGIIATLVHRSIILDLKPSTTILQAKAQIR